MRAENMYINPCQPMNDVFSQRCGVAEDHFVKMVCILRELDIRAIWDSQCPVSFTHGRWM